MIQIITYDKEKYRKPKSEFKISSLDEFESFDDYEISIIDLSCEEMWKNDADRISGLNNLSDLDTLKKEIQCFKSSKVIIVFPQNCDYKYSISYNGTYIKKIKLKDMLSQFIHTISNHLFKIEGFDITYSKNKTTIDNKLYKSDFSFNETNVNALNIIHKSNCSNKNTTILYNNLLITTLNILESEEHLRVFISPLLVSNNNQEKVPEWIKNMDFYNDNDLKNKRLLNQNEINNLLEKNKKINLELEENNKFKSILYTTGEDLSNIVMKILDKLLDYDSSGFIDKKREDFLIKKENITFIGEIKGVSSAVSNKNVSQLDVHVQEYNDNLLKDNLKENVKGLLIINHQRTKKLTERNEIHDMQKKLAIRNDSLIIETSILLKLFEKYLKKEIDTNDVIRLFKDKTGVLTEKDI